MFHAVLVMALFMYPSFAAQSAAPAQAHLGNADVLRGWVTNANGERLRTYVTRPKSATGKVPVIFFVGWLSCDSMEYANGETDGFGALILRLINQSGYATVRMDKPGVGESQGTCAKADFDAELSGWRAAFASMSQYEFIDIDRVIVLGMSNGGGFAPLVAQGATVRGYIAASTWGRTWYEHMLELERRRLTAAGKTPSEISQAVKVFTQFYDLYLNQGLTPGQVIAQHSQWKDLWYDESDGQYGRPAAFYQQLQGLNLGQTWQEVNAPVLVIYGTADTIMSRADSDAISEIVNTAHPGAAENFIVDRMTHLFEVDGKFYDTLVPKLLNWMSERVSPHATR